jgi:hypothetical protein
MAIRLFHASFRSRKGEVASFTVQNDPFAYRKGRIVIDILLVSM